MTQTIAPHWEAKRTNESRMVEDVLRQAGFEQVDAYRYNSASLRLRVIDRRFEGRSIEDRDAMVEPHLAQLPERTQADIVNLFTFAPSEIQPPPASSSFDERANHLKERMINSEFENPSPSMF